MKVLFLITAFAAAVLVGCVSADARSARCLPVSETVLQSIEEGLTVSDGRLKNGWAVKSKDLFNMYFLSAQMFGGSLSGEVGTWTTNSITEVVEDNLIAVGHYASNFSEWGWDSGMKDQFSETDDGYSESQKCASQ